jgi:hypothetical protein
MLLERPARDYTALIATTAGVVGKESAQMTTKEATTNEANPAVAARRAAAWGPTNKAIQPQEAASERSPAAEHSQPAVRNSIAARKAAAR